MRSFKKTKIIHKFLLFVLPLAVFSIIITSIVLSWTSYNYFQKTINQDYRNIIKSSAGEIRLYMENSRKNLDSLAGIIAATKIDKWQQQMALTAFNRCSAEFMAVSLMSLEGETIATTRWEPQDLAIGQSAYFNKALSGQTAVSPVMMAKEKLPFVYIVVPVIKRGQVDKILWGELNLKSVWDVLEGITVGRTGQIFIMDKAGRYIAHREIARVVASPSPENTKFLEKLGRSDQPIRWTDHKNGNKFYYCGIYIPDLDWVIVLQQSLPEIYSFLYRNIYSAVVLTGLICLTALVFGWHQVKRFLTPIQSLHQQVQRISEGGLNHKVSVKTADEIGELGLAFNHMTDALNVHVQREIETAKDLVHAKNLAVLGTTSSKVTHEVGNLLNNIGTALTVLQREDLSPKGIKMQKILAQESDRVKTFIHSFLQFAKKPDLQLQQAFLDLVIKEALANLGPEAEKKGVQFELDWLPKTLLVNIDTRLMYQAVNNLVKNSLDAIDDSGVIRITGDIDGRHLRVVFEDTGPGIKPEALDHIFDPFFTTKGNAGTGLGLSIVKTIIEAHRGTIECQSELNNGTTVVINLPLQ